MLVQRRRIRAGRSRRRSETSRLSGSPFGLRLDPEAWTGFRDGLGLNHLSGKKLSFVSVRKRSSVQFLSNRSFALNGVKAAVQRIVCLIIAS